MKQRNIWIILLLNIVTLGIYQIFWTKFTRDEMVAKGQHIPRFIWLFAPILAMTAIIIFMFVTLAANSNGTGNDDEYGRYGTELSEEYTGDYDRGEAAIGLTTALGMLVATLGFFAVFIWWFYHYSKAVEAVTNGHLSFGMAYGLWWVLTLFSVGFIWPLIIQDGLNKVAGGDNTPHDNPQKPGQIPDTPYPTNTAFGR